MQFCISRHLTFFETHRKDKNSTHAVDVHLLKGISLPDSHTETPHESPILANMQRHTTLCFYLMTVTADRHYSNPVKLKLWVDRHLQVQLIALKVSHITECEASQVQLSPKYVCSAQKAACQFSSDHTSLKNWEAMSGTLSLQSLFFMYGLNNYSFINNVCIFLFYSKSTGFLIIPLLRYS